MPLKLDDASVQTHIGSFQAIINRLAGNSAQCKTWSVTLASALIVLMIDKGKDSLLVGLIPCVVFSILDAFYLFLERDFRRQYNEFVDSLHSGSAQPRVFDLSGPSGTRPYLMGVGCSFLSFSVWPFYLTLAGAVVVARWQLV